MLKINLFQFDEEGSDVSSFISNGELDVDGLVDAFSQEEEGTEEEVTPSETELEVEGDAADDILPEEGEAEGTQDEITATPEADGKRTTDQAFAEMRRQIEANQPIAEWVTTLAEQQGFSSPNELIEAYEQQRIAQQAQEQNIPVEILQRLQHLESENAQTKEAAINSQFNHDVETVKNKYNLNDDDLRNVFSFMGKNNFDAGSLPFEQIYILANHETIVQDAEERGRQSYLEEKKQKQQGATPIIKTNKNDKDVGELDYSREGIFKTLEEMDIDFS